MIIKRPENCSEEVLMWSPDNCYEEYLHDVWHVLTTGQQTKMKNTARESFYGMLRTQLGVQKQLTQAGFHHFEAEYMKHLRY